MLCIFMRATCNLCKLSFTMSHMGRAWSVCPCISTVSTSPYRLQSWTELHWAPTLLSKSESNKAKLYSSVHLLQHRTNPKYMQHMTKRNWALGARKRNTAIPSKSHSHQEDLVGNWTSGSLPSKGVWTSTMNHLVCLACSAEQLHPGTDMNLSFLQIIHTSWSNIFHKRKAIPSLPTCPVCLGGPPGMQMCPGAPCEGSIEATQVVLPREMLGYTEIQTGMVLKNMSKLWVLNHPTILASHLAGVVVTGERSWIGTDPWKLTDSWSLGSVSSHCWFQSMLPKHSGPKVLICSGCRGSSTCEKCATFPTITAVITDLMNKVSWQCPQHINRQLHNTYCIQLQQDQHKRQIMEGWCQWR